MFDGPKLKIKRADQHIKKLDALIREFVETDFCALDVEKDANGHNVVRFKQTKPMPDEVALVIGDAIHNMRSALDLLACEIVTLAGEVPSKWTTFPVRDTRQELEAALNGGQIKIAGADIIDLILNAIKPYVGGNDALCGLHALDITDKHKLIIPIVSVAALTNVNAKIGGITFTNCEFAVGADRILNIAALPPGDIQFKGKATPAISVVFDKGPFEGEPIPPTLHQLSQLVSGIIETINKAYLAKSTS